MSSKQMSFRLLKSQIEGMDNGKAAWAVIEPLWSAVDFSKGRKHVTETLSRATEGQKLLFAVDWCQKEVRNGGFEQFFLNSAGMIWQEALAGFRAIGAVDYADLLQKALGVFAGEVPTSKKERAKLLRSVPKQAREELFVPLDTQFFRLLNKEDTNLESFRARYIYAHPREFFND